MKTFKKKNSANLADRLSCAVRVVLDGQMTLSLAVFTYARPNEMSLFLNTIKDSILMSFVEYEDEYIA